MRFSKLHWCGALIVLFIAAHVVAACSCVRSGTVDLEFEKTPNVVIVKLRSVEKLADGEKGFGVQGIKESKVTVEKVYKGNLIVGQELRFTQGGGGDCVWTFSEEVIGSEYLFYLGAKPEKSGLWISWTCTRSSGKDSAGADLLYLENLAKVRGKTRLSGTLTQIINSNVEDGESSYNRLAGRHILLTGNGKKLGIKTDKNGVYEVYDLPPGKYKMAPEKIEGYKFYDKFDSVEIEITAKSHAEQNFRFRTDNALRGKFYDANGNPLKDVCLRLRPARGKESQGLFAMDCTGDDGSFEIDEVPTGTYVIVINEDGKITANQPFGTFYFPSTTRREEAAEIYIGPGEFRENLIINAPETAETITLSGILSFQNGLPADKTNSEYVSVEFFTDKEGSKSDEDGEADSQADIDDKGRFSIRVLKGTKGRLYASFMTYEGKYENCPKMDKFIRDKKENMPQIKSNEVRIDAINDLSAIELIFPFPSCKIRKIDD